MADIALDADALRRDRQRYHGLLTQAEQQIAAWNERADHLQQAIDGLDRLLALAADDPALDGGVPRGTVVGRGVPPHPPGTEQPAGSGGRTQPAGAGGVSQPAGAGGVSQPAPAAEAGGGGEPERPRRAATRNTGGRARRNAAGRAPAAKRAPSPTATPAAPDPVEPPAAPASDAPRGTDALRLVFDSDPERTWALPELIESLDSRGWLPTSRRPEEGVRISLKRLAERGGVTRTDDGRWRRSESPDQAASQPASGPPWPQAEEPPAPEAPKAEVMPAAEEPHPEPPPPPAPPDPRPRPASFGRPVGGTVTEI